MLKFSKLRFTFLLACDASSGISIVTPACGTRRTIRTRGLRSSVTLCGALPRLLADGWIERDISDDKRHGSDRVRGYPNAKSLTRAATARMAPPWG